MIKVACYCRVSTSSSDQVNSLDSQRRFFRDYLAGMDELELYGIYADEGITGTSTKNRQAFQRMIQDAYAGKFQRILTKEVSRFSRNILDTIAYTRELKALGVGVLFLTDGFSSIDADAELRLSIMGSLAQEESRRTSTRVKWGQTRQMERGIVFGTSMLGYDVKAGKMTVNPEGAEIVKSIFHKYAVERKGTTVIAKELEAAGIRTYEGNHKWQESTILRILKNEKYAGDLIQKKTVTPDYLTHEKKYNNGLEPKIILKDHHEPIINRELWNLAQVEICRRRRRKNATQSSSQKYPFSGKIVCGCCGRSFISRTKQTSDGTVIHKWGCSTAAKEGRGKADLRGQRIGCDIGIILRDEMVREMVRFAISQSIKKDCQLIPNILRLVLQVTAVDPARTKNKERIQKSVKVLECKQKKAVEAYLHGIITETELGEIRENLARQRKELDDHLQNHSSDSILTQENIRIKAEEILQCNGTSETLFRVLTEQICIDQNGIAEVALRDCPLIWKFRVC